MLRKTKGLTLFYTYENKAQPLLFTKTTKQCQPFLYDRTAEISQQLNITVLPHSNNVQHDIVYCEFLT